MKTSTQRLPESQVLLEVEVDPDRMERSMDKAYRRLAERVEVPGFRRGKTPRAMLERHIGRARLVQEALDILIPEAYNEAIEKEDIDAIGQPEIELTGEEPLSFKATVPVRPTVKLGDYSSLRVPREPVEVDEKDVEASIEELRRRYALHEPVERPIQMGDIVRAGVRIVIEGQEVYKDEDAEFRIREEGVLFLPGFKEGLIGAEKGSTREITVTVPEGEGRLAGKQGTATVTVKEVKAEQLPEPNDEFAQQVGEGFPSLDALRERLRSDIRERLESEAEEAYHEKLVLGLVEQAEAIEFPPVLVEREIERLIRDQARSAGMEVEAYLEMIKRTPEQLREELGPAATERIRRSLALSQFAEEENIQVEPAEIDAEIARMASPPGAQGQQMRALFSSPDGRAALERSIRTRKALERLDEIAGRDGNFAPESKKNPAAFKKAAVKEE